MSVRFLAFVFVTSMATVAAAQDLCISYDCVIPPGGTVNECAYCDSSFFSGPSSCIPPNQVPPCGDFDIGCKPPNGCLTDGFCDTGIGGPGGDCSSLDSFYGTSNGNCVGIQWVQIIARPLKSEWVLVRVAIRTNHARPPSTS